MTVSRTFGVSLVRDLALALDAASVYGSDLASNHDSIIELNEQLTVSRNRVATLERTVMHDRDLAVSLANEVALDLAVVLSFATSAMREPEALFKRNESRPQLDVQASIDAMAATRDRDLASNLSDCIRRAQQMSRSIPGALEALKSDRTVDLISPERKIASRLPWRTVLWAIQVLPSKYRARYHEEFLAEFDELAQYSPSRRMQIMHALGILSRVVSLRIALRGHPEADQSTTRPTGSP